MLTINTADLKPAELQNYLQYAIAPRPICFVSTIDQQGNVNLSPFSFFNIFSINPPICVFSPSRRVRDNTTKHSLENILEVPECVINIVNYDMVQQTSLASVEYPKGVNEFIKAGFTQLPSVSSENLFEVTKPVRTIGIGVDSLPDAIRNSMILTGNNLGQLGNIESLPSDEEIAAFGSDPELRQILDATIGDSKTRERELHVYAKKLLESKDVIKAWKVLLS
jgi:hypothetical protein